MIIPATCCYLFHWTGLYLTWIHEYIRICTKYIKIYCSMMQPENCMWIIVTRRRKTKKKKNNRLQKKVQHLPQKLTKPTYSKKKCCYFPKRFLRSPQNFSELLRIACGHIGMRHLAGLFGCPPKSPSLTIYIHLLLWECLGEMPKQ